MGTAARLSERGPSARSALWAIMIAVAVFISGSDISGAQDYPARPIKLVVPFIAGSPVDALARVVAQNLSPLLGQSIVIENQSGAGGTLGSRAVASAGRDGYTLLFAINSHVYGLYAKPGYDPIKSFEPVAAIAEWSHVLVVQPDFPAKTLGELIAYARSNPGKVTFGYGTNTPPQILGETLKIATKVDIQSIPYRGGAQAIQDMLGGRIDMNFGATSTLLPLIQEGKLRAIAFTGSKRTAELPAVPTVAEAGFPQIAFNPDAWAAVLAPAGTPSPIVDKLNAQINQSLESPELHASLAKLGYQRKPMSRRDFSVFLASEMKRWPPIVSAAGLKAE
jgi:tripartite-type tricarboxylate transporter receptor subunit TctC